ncbi:hypothetical protein LBMAG42_48140 [Deltaproteobacteria bacterium]|nr:hypothetical protein LBMAG42_48140 [Deltaproteobacteria bacterium]
MLILMMACATETTQPAGSDSAAPDSSITGGAEADLLFDVSVLHELVVTLPEADWDALREQTRSYYSLLGEGCMEGPWESPYTYFEGEVSFDGEALGTVGVRKKGLIGSLSTERPSLKVDVDHYVDDARFHGLEKLVFNNNNQDAGRLRTCLAHDFFRDAGLVAPRCALAHVTVNGEDLGIYSHTENIDEELVARQTGTRPDAMYEGTLSDFREEWLATFDPETDTSDGHELEAVRVALEAGDDEVMAALDEVIDLDSFFTFWAAESLAGHWDGYNGNTNNFYTYVESGRLKFIASGPDATFDSRSPFGEGQPIWVTTASTLANRLIQLDDGKARYLDAMQGLLDGAWNEDARLAQVDAFDDLTRDLQTKEQRDGIAATRAVIEARAGDLEASMGGRFTPPGLRGNPCFTDIGHVRIDFATEFGTYPDGDLFGGGEAISDYVFRDVAYPSIADGVSAGWADDGRALVLTISQLNETTFVAPYVLVDPDLFTSGAALNIDGIAAEGAILYQDATTGGAWETVAYLGGEGVTFIEAGTSRGDTVSGVLDVGVLGSAE